MPNSHYNGKQVSPTSTPDVSKCIVVGAGAEPVVKAYGFFHPLFQTQFKHEHTVLGDGRNPCYCGRYYAKWACGHYTAPRFICCKQTFSSNVRGKPVQCQSPMKDIIIDNLVSVEQCPNCTAFDEDAELAFLELDEEEAFWRDAEEAFQQIDEEKRQREAESLPQGQESAVEEKVVSRDK
ncbi:hypothetical protein PG985_001081 [Apiospora marii]|uniref:uncharacterized protein n=1 Tax=Apiospora marii TaxID=335849 RepID=UPI00312D8B33